MNSCLLEHSYAYGEILKSEHPFLGAAALIFLLLLLFRLPGKILGLIGSLLYAALRLTWRVLNKITGSVLMLPVRMFKKLFAARPKVDLRDYALRTEMKNPYFYDVRAKPPPRPVRVRRVSWRDMVMYLAVTVIFLLIIDDYYNNCAMLDGILNRIS